MSSFWTGSGGAAVVTFLSVSHQARLALVAAETELKAPFAEELPSRKEQLAALQTTQEFDVLVVGGGATGVGCALDAVTRSEFPGNAEGPPEEPPCPWSCWGGAGGLLLWLTSAPPFLQT